jgi:MYXO-CTERM domain-containing protein
VQGDRSASDLVVFVGKDGVAPDTSVEANGTTHGASLVVEESTTLCNHDLAFVVLQQSLDVPVAPIRLGGPALDEKVSAIGWGVDASGSLAKTREVRNGIPLIGVGPGQYPNDPSYGYGTSEFMIGESACSGDSGGPTIASTGAVVGVASRAGNGLPRDPANYAATCVGAEAHAVYTHLGEHKDLVTRAFQAAGAQPKLEVTPQVAAPVAAAAPPAPPEAPASTQAPATKAPGPDPAADAPAGGCSMSSEPQTGSVEYAAGLVALLALMLGLRRRLRAHREEQAELELEEMRERLPSIP